MSTTSEIAKRLDGMFVRFATETEDEAAIRRVATAREAAKRLSEMERENARLTSALQQISGTSSKLCPFTRGVPNNLQPTDPCPVCGDKGDFSDETTSKASRCVGNAPSAIARAALAGSGE
jgi:rubrerythrin